MELDSPKCQRLTEKKKKQKGNNERTRTVGRIIKD
jgi:hypothetical protein